MTYVRLAALVLLFGIGSAALAQTNPLTEVDHLALEYPRGRFHQGAPPNFFKWSGMNNSSSITLKIYKQNKLLFKFDFPAGTTTYSWQHSPIPAGEYSWSIETFNFTNPKPASVSKAHFTVEEITGLNLNSHTLAPILGFGTGNYTSSDPVADIDYETTPRVYGLIYRNAYDNQISSLELTAKDYTVERKVTIPFNVTYGHYWRIYGTNAYRTEIFLAPTLSYYSIPQLKTTDAINFTVTEHQFASGGLSLIGHRQLSDYLTAHAKISANAVFWGPSNLTLKSSAPNILASAGLMLNAFWPLGFNGEIEYSSENISFKKGASDVEITNNIWAAKGYVVYSF